jgi:hypothetical protein
MEKQPSRSMKIYLAVLVIAGWFALIAQFYININSKAASIAEIIIRYFSYFTITTNLIVSVCCSILLLKPNSTRDGFFSRQKTLTAITVYIIIVGIIYNSILRFIWNPQGLQRVVDELLHSVIPLLFLIYWLLFVEKKKLHWQALLPWLTYPVVYIIFILIRGSVSGFYPYPFINVTQLGLQKALINAAGIALVFVTVSLLFITIGNRLTKKNG